jgi:hypothetical protein
MPAFEPPSLQYLAPVLGAHALAKAVYLRTLALLGLKSP